MKLTEKKLKGIIREEVESNEALIDAIERLIDKIEDLDTSMDYVASAVTGEDPLSIALGQKSIGRSYRSYARRDKDLEEEIEKFKSALKEELEKEGILLTEKEEDEAISAFRKARNAARKKAAKTAAIAGIAGGLGMGALGLATGEYAQEKSQQRQDIAAQAEIESSSDAAQYEEMVDHLNNTVAFRWGEGNQTAMPYPGTDGDVTVLPVSYSIAVQALLDKQENLERIEQGQKPLSRFGAPDLEDLPSLSDKASAEEKGDASENFKEFFNKYATKDMIDVMPVIQDIEGLEVVPGSGTEKMIVMVKPSSISADYILPELGMTVADYYDSQYYGNFLGSGEAEALDLADEADEEMVVTPEPDTEIEPEFVQSHEKYANRGG